MTLWMLLAWEKKKFATYWANTSSNSLAALVIRQGSPEVKMTMESLLRGDTLTVRLDEQIIFDQLEEDETAVWSLLLASGYLKVVRSEFLMEEGCMEYELALTNREVIFLFKQMIRQWFKKPSARYNDFIKALLLNDKKAMNRYMNAVALQTFSYFDTGNRASEQAEPERLASCCDRMGAANGSSLCDSTNLQSEANASHFYHGFVLGLMVDLADRYRITSNRESGFGRYDVMMVPKAADAPAYVLEFKVYDPEDEKDLGDTVQAALKQIEEKQYDAELEAQGIMAERIYHYGFAFRGKEVLIGG